MITILEAIKLSTEYLEKKNVESPRTNAEILLSEILKVKRLDLYLSFDKPLNETELVTYREFIKKRGLRIPLQYIIGYVDFFGLKIKVNENVLIPRPETELLVEKIIEETTDNVGLQVLDIGSGSGNISLAVAKNLSDSFITAIEISKQALNLSKENADNNLVKNVKFICKDIFDDDVISLGKFDIIVSNPPYVSINEYQTLEPELKNYEPKIALTDNEDGLKFYKRIALVSKSILNLDGKIFLELGKGQYPLVKDIFTSTGFNKVRVFKDYQGIDRIFLGELNWEH